MKKGCPSPYLKWSIASTTEECDLEEDEDLIFCVGEDVDPVTPDDIEYPAEDESSEADDQRPIRKYEPKSDKLRHMDRLSKGDSGSAFVCE